MTIPVKAVAHFKNECLESKYTSAIFVETSKIKDVVHQGVVLDEFFGIFIKSLFRYTFLIMRDIWTMILEIMLIAGSGDHVVSFLWCSAA